ncbi:TetR/AcrR family transcriptional regulator [Pseudoduganella ginsengisoli]|uniref:TetR family transcriptional regulator n=1 Tax=Pseudoduganella ginsengisoli TaxID=1462440 RepID=A0A6L6Q025_9BURK|nr:TetR/AcrR family transcriptional regulator [Pseudoduganella ginsengisoli]MTW02759.1 TetR family transcriptional regulator [Pseudoduganella ginsengisoli]
MSHNEKRHSDAERAQVRRQQVLDAAAICFKRSGFHGASMSEISKAAGMSAGHIYNYFDSKDAIIAAFVEQNVERVTAILRDLEQRADPLMGLVDDTENSVTDHVESDRIALRLEIWAEASRNPAIAAVVRDADLRSRTHFRAVLKNARELRQLDASDATVDGLMEAVIALFHGLHVRAIHNPDAARPAIVASVRNALRAMLFS